METIKKLMEKELDINEIALEILKSMSNRYSFAEDRMGHEEVCKLAFNIADSFIKESKERMKIYEQEELYKKQEELCNIFYQPLIDPKKPWLNDSTLPNGGFELWVRCHRIIYDLALGKFEKYKHIEFIGDLIQLTGDDFLSLHDFGRKSLNELKENLIKIDQRLSLGKQLPETIINNLNKIRINKKKSKNERIRKI